MRYHRTTGLSTEAINYLAREVAGLVIWSSGNTFSAFQGVAMTLEYYRTNLSQGMLAAFHGTSQPTLSRIIATLEEGLAHIVTEFCIDLDDLKYDATLLDGFLIPTGNRSDQDKLYSGKRRQSGVGAQVVATLYGRLLTVSEIFRGSTHDVTAFRNSSLASLLNQSNAIADGGYRGTNMVIPIRKPNGYELDADRAAFNAALTGWRAPAERVIAHLKNWNILATGYHRRLCHLQRVVHIITRLKRFRACYAAS
ncbi:Helix-turn-helix of DDE superfamily endonuclease [Actinopolyspora lacussalsi subsp. righensis]|uniref:Helix-turn-helix of DDE superfamily endonuclease n=1 Tax=Actinopolyspora righensis TaxID=995060 RepID=A0A1I7BCC7_9ACTN|nr:Helix-turn-helix of DDE superfamily endonuclease [Actinopolyspora righensis]